MKIISISLFPFPDTFKNSTRNLLINYNPRKGTTIQKQGICENTYSPGLVCPGNGFNQPKMWIIYWQNTNKIILSGNPASSIRFSRAKRTLKNRRLAVCANIDRAMIALGVIPQI